MSTLAGPHSSCGRRQNGPEHRRLTKSEAISANDQQKFAGPNFTINVSRIAPRLKMISGVTRGTAMVAFAALALVPSGCGKNPDVATVTGVVTLNGKPMKSVYIQFIPSKHEDGRPASYATTDKDGRFELRLYQEVGGKESGAVVGEHVVALQDFDRPAAPPIPPSKIAPKFALPHKSPLRVNITAPAELTFSVDDQGIVTVK